MLSAIFEFALIFDPRQKRLQSYLDPFVIRIIRIFGPQRDQDAVIYGPLHVCLDSVRSPEDETEVSGFCPPLVPRRLILTFIWKIIWNVNLHALDH